MLILLSSFVYATYIHSEEHYGVRWKFYDDSIPKDVCLEHFKSIPSNYTEGINYIMVWSSPKADRLGAFFPVINMIHLYNNCSEYHTLAHEVAHYHDFKDGFKYGNEASHDEEFWQINDEIMDATR